MSTTLKYKEGVHYRYLFIRFVENLFVNQFNAHCKVHIPGAFNLYKARERNDCSLISFYGFVRVVSYFNYIMYMLISYGILNCFDYEL